MKNKKIKIIMTSLLCAGIVSATSFAVMANANVSGDKQTAKNNLSGTLQTMSSESGLDAATEGEKIRGFIKNGKFPEGFELAEGIELPEGAAEWHTSIFSGERSGFNFGIAIDGIKGVFGSGGVSIADILGVSEEELETALEEADGDIFKILEDSGKLDEYKAKLLENCKTRLDEQVAAGKITQEKANETIAAFEEAIDNFSSGDGLRMSNFSIAIDGAKGHFGFGDGSVADILGISEDELEAALEEADGDIFKILEDAGKLDEYKAKMLENCKTRLDEQVAAGKITQEKADEVMATFEEAIDNFSSGDVLTMPGFGHGRKSIDFEKSERSSGEKRVKSDQTSGV